jgi:hypothetical protein
VGVRETSANEPLMTHRNSLEDIETGELLCPGMSMAGTHLPAMRCPVSGRPEPHSGFRTELMNLVGSVKGKGTMVPGRHEEPHAVREILQPVLFNRTG